MRALCVGCHRAPSASACPRLRVSSRAMANRQAALATHTEEVAAPFSVVWKLLEAKVYHPELSVPGVSNVRILADKGPVEGVERLMFQAMRGADIHELITWENSAEQGIVRFEMLSDPCLEGMVLNVAIALSPSSTKLMYLMDWHYRADVAAEARKAPFPDNGNGAISGAVKGMKAAAEKIAAAAPA